ncbi:bifunctional DNA-formamidopyrimidine glycosylase/DNA-(apurinic or apyrimidinic site) lyase [candidate division KSB1 bacterium]|nr:bifunctional DNA-formamidopyrimidine glycosylase/DNA-(apurinic or apyrimidinic site) lyase [candidate division KSB1 bacterium]
MPELPEVETIVRQVRPHIVNRPIEAMCILRPSQWKHNDAQDAEQRLIGKLFAAVNRRAKFFVFDVNDGQTFILHLRMSGKLLLSDSWNPIDDYSRTIWQFADGGSLQFNDTRALGTLELLFPGEQSASLHGLGMEPLGDSYQFEALKIMLEKSAKPIKVFLLDQTKVVGVGNIYANEILFRTHIHPLRPANTLTTPEQQALFETIPQMLQTAIDHMGTTLGNKSSDFRSIHNIDGDFQTLLKVYAREGEPCFTCGTEIERIAHHGRSSFVCPHCQPFLGAPM